MRTLKVAALVTLGIAVGALGVMVLTGDGSQERSVPTTATLAAALLTEASISTATTDSSTTVAATSTTLATTTTEITFADPTVVTTTVPTTVPTTTVSNPGNVVNCADFDTWQKAQDYFETYAPRYGDVALIDTNDNGIACETLIPEGKQVIHTDDGTTMVDISTTTVQRTTTTKKRATPTTRATTRTCTHWHSGNPKHTHPGTNHDGTHNSRGAKCYGF